MSKWISLKDRLPDGDDDIFFAGLFSVDKCFYARVLSMEKMMSEPLFGYTICFHDGHFYDVPYKNWSERKLINTFTHWIPAELFEFILENEDKGEKDERMDKR